MKEINKEMVDIMRIDIEMEETIMIDREQEEVMMIEMEIMIQDMKMLGEVEITQFRDSKVNSNNKIMQESINLKVEFKTC